MLENLLHLGWNLLVCTSSCILYFGNWLGSRSNQVCFNTKQFVQDRTSLLLAISNSLQIGNQIFTVTSECTEVHLLIGKVRIRFVRRISLDELSRDLSTLQVTKLIQELPSLSTQRSLKSSHQVIRSILLYLQTKRAHHLLTQRSNNVSFIGSCTTKSIQQRTTYLVELIQVQHCFDVFVGVVCRLVCVLCYVGKSSQCNSCVQVLIH